VKIFRSAFTVSALCGIAMISTPVTGEHSGHGNHGGHGETVTSNARKQAAPSATVQLAMTGKRQVMW
jgi:hypothetical protein